MISIVYFHQSSELYGSDRALLTLIEGIVRYDTRVIVVLPNNGPLVRELNKLGVKVLIIDIVVLGRSALSIKGILLLPFKIVKSVIIIDYALKKQKIDIVHSNTLAVLTGAIWAKLRRKKHVWHVHEIIVKPLFAAKLFVTMLKMFATIIICNSLATRKWIMNINSTLWRKMYVIHNGITNKHYYYISNMKKKLGIKDEQIVITLVGRINRMKGHNLLLHALTLLRKIDIQRCHIVIVGGSPEGQEYHKINLIKKIRFHKYRKNITYSNYIEKINIIWKFSDIVVVPSTEPESFGLVAIEAMMHEKPVIAAAHGGILDIVVHNNTGLLFKPNNIYSLAKSLKLLVGSKKMREYYGRRGYARYKRYFSKQKYVSEVINMYYRLCI